MSFNAGEEPHTGLEVERRYVILPENVGALAMRAEAVTYIQQGYLFLPTGPDGEQEKYRVREERDMLHDTAPTYTLTHKKRLDDLVRVETEQQIDEAHFKVAWDLTLWSIAKTRLTVPGIGDNERERTGGSHTLDLDLLPSTLAIGEIEFKSREIAEAFRTPPWCGPEITGLQRWGTSGLARYPMGPQELAHVMRVARQGGKLGSRKKKYVE